MFAYSFFGVEESQLSSKNAIKLEDSLLTSLDVKNIQNHCNSRPKTVFPKMVLIIIDALRADFIPSIQFNPALAKTHRMPFVEKVLNTNGIGKTYDS